MLIDVLTFRQQLREIDNLLRDYRVEKVVPLSYNHFSVVFHHPARPKQALLIDLGESPHIYLTSQRFPKGKAGSFTLSLEKHLLAGRVTKVQQRDTDYVAEFFFGSDSSIGEGSRLSLIIELCSRKTNLILLNGETILDVCTKVPATKNRYRTLLAGEVYQPPPLPAALIPDKISLEQWDETLLSGNQPDVWGVSRLHLAWIGSSYERLGRLLKPTEGDAYLYQAGEQYFVSPLKLDDYSLEAAYPGINEAVESFYCTIYKKILVDKAKRQLKKQLNTRRQKLEKRLVRIAADLDNSKQAERFQRFGDLILANLRTARIQDDKLSVLDYYQESSPVVEIIADPTKSLQENAKSYFQRAKRARRGYELVMERQRSSELELDEIERQLMAIEEINELEDIKGMLRGHHASTNKIPKTAIIGDRFRGIYRFQINDKYEFWVGKSREGNEKLLKLARGSDIWMHVQGFHGSHLIIRVRGKNEAVPLDILLKAASIAAYHSKARNKDKVEVSYTRRKHVTKQRGKVGAVVYSQQKTLLVVPMSFDQGDSNE